jgi:hypothetical protein
VAGTHIASGVIHKYRYIGIDYVLRLGHGTKRLVS